ncbi:zinc metalloprotease HtpX [bacterium]|nr:zinc metalloprotease HtpX [bacterium]MBU1024910.1 zinc metalloprotease HtpX [bacterium]
MFYQAIEANKTKTVFLMIAFVIVITAIGWAVGYFMGAGGEFAMVIAIVLALFMVWGGYYYSDKLVIASVGAQPVEKFNEPYLVNVVEGLTIAAGFGTIPKTYIIESPALNAFATGRNPDNAAICVTRGLLERLNRQELEGVIAHEMSHIRNYDILIMTVAAVMVGGVAILSRIIFRYMFWGGGGRSRRSDSRGGGGQAILMVVAIVLLILAPILVNLMKLALSRNREYLADASAVQLTRNPDGLIGALKKLSRDDEKIDGVSDATAHLFIANPFKKKAMLAMFSTHPPIEDRITALSKM